ncbi:hemerythrin domain-containing protein [Modicisalibacter luteus]|uniref:Hemerythrin domain-containing protein n=1 Tax=Modicisalibacter luteus TaxID=453962 RepID=A0ABV7M0P4_9GAMM|nr:hemerythrin domain-containing protein [Halomonas lutea]GHA92120.1 hypothetical protein GCM10007159_12080 [Halomonas lutea]
MNALELLKEDHDKVRDLLSQLTNTTERAEKKRPELLAKIEKEVMVHSKIEEEIFYPAFKKASGKQNDRMYYEAQEEHHAVNDLVLPDLKAADPTGTEFSGRAKVVKELLEHHIDEEEEEMFEQARKTMSERELEALGEQMLARKKELMAA